MRKLAIPLLLGVLILIGFFVLHNFLSKGGVDTSQEGLQKTNLSAKDIQLAWPSVGQAAVANVEDGVIAHSSDNEKQRPIASMAKVITALAIMEKQPFKLGQGGQTITITRDDIDSMVAYIEEEGSVQPLLIGMKLTQYQAMQRVLMASDNNMADILVERIFGSQEAYVSYANDMLKRMGLSHTHVADPSGFDANTVSTPSDIVAIGIAALNNPVIAEIVAQEQAEIPGAHTITVKNTNQLLGTQGVIGIKTGTTDEAGSCLLFATRYTDADGNEKTIVGVIMGDTNHDILYSDSRKLLTSAKQGFGLAEGESVDNVVASPQKLKGDRTPRQ